LLGKVGKDASEINVDKQIVAGAVVSAALKDAGFSDIKASEKDGTAFVFLGHGTSHAAKVTYSQMQTQMKELGFENVFIGTVEGEPEETSCEAVLEAVHEAGYKKVVLRPLMVVAGDHANNDMAGDDEDSWKSVFEASGYFESVDCQIKGLGSIDTVQKLYVAHSQAATGVPEVEVFGTLFPDLELSTDAQTSENNDDTSKANEVLPDGVYSAKFKTDSSMFRVNEANDGKGRLTVKDGQMSIHVSLVSKKILNLFPGLAEDAQKEGAVLLQPTTDTVTYSDGETEEVYGFDIPVAALNEEFDLALIGTSGKWYDHKVSVTNPKPIEGTTLLDGTYQIDVILSGGSGKASVKSPAKLMIKDGKMTATIVWSSSYYDYMIIDGEKILPLTTEGGSTFVIPVAVLDKEIPVIADTVAMSQPHEIEYTLFFGSSSIVP
ncbi:MAG: sirohydrochlorin cobaltochelatase, partial [Lachnospiraceae bacterium]